METFLARIKSDLISAAPFMEFSLATFGIDKNDGVLIVVRECLGTIKVISEDFLGPSDFSDSAVSVSIKNIPEDGTKNSSLKNHVR